MNDGRRNDEFTFEISLSVLNHLGRNLYRSFATVLGEAISNSWDANAENVELFIDRDSSSFYIKDDGDGMNAHDFQHKFLKIGYSKRNESDVSPDKERPYIGRKGIGKLALLSCADRVMVISKADGNDYVGGTIDNAGLDEAIEDDQKPEEYSLDQWDMEIFSDMIEGHKHGTIIYFDGIHEGINHTIEFFKKIVALYFRFSLVDSDFTIFINDDKIKLDCLKDLISHTEFCWQINELDDPYVEMLLDSFEEDTNESKKLSSTLMIKGFIASVKKPRNLKILTTDENVSVDLYVNGRLRERDILKHIPTARVVESYLYGQIHYDVLDDDEDRFATSREGIKAGDPVFKQLLEELKLKILPIILQDWDDWRRKHKKKGDPENKKITPRERSAEELYNEVSKDYELPEDSEHRREVNTWIDSLNSDAKFNFPSYAECFISENLIRRYIFEKKIELSKEAIRDIEHYIEKESRNKDKGNISIEIRHKRDKLSYLDMDGLAYLVDNEKSEEKACLARNADEYKPLRDALAHTALLTDQAKLKLTSVFENIRQRIITLLSK